MKTTQEAPQTTPEAAIHGGGQRLELESLVLEYKNSFDRSTKLDNKVYIAITFCGFLFVFITNLFSGLTELHRPELPVQWALTALYIATCVLVMIAYVSLLLFFLNLLRPEKIHRMDPKYTQQEQLSRLSEEDACARLIELYRETVNENLEKLHARCDAFTRGLKYVICTVVLAFVAYAFRILLLLAAHL